MLINLKSYPGIQLDSIADFSPTAATEVQTVRTIADANGSLGGRYFHLYSRDNLTVYTPGERRGEKGSLVPITALWKPTYSLALWIWRETKTKARKGNRPLA